VKLGRRANSKDLIRVKSGHVEWEGEHSLKIINRKLNGTNGRTKEAYLLNVKTGERVGL